MSEEDESPPLVRPKALSAEKISDIVVYFLTEIASSEAISEETSVETVTVDSVFAVTS